VTSVGTANACPAGAPESVIVSSRASTEVAAGNRGEQRLSIGVLRIAEDVSDEAGFHHLAAPHHRDEIADLGRDAQIMGDEDDRQAKPLAQIRQQLQHLRLHGNVERRDRLVGHQHVGLQRQGPARPMRWRWPPENSCG
jgi:hypothetical protein